MRVALRPVVAALVLFPMTALAPAPVLAGDTVHVVSKGQTLGRIAKRYNTTVDALRTANDLERGEKIRPGLELVIPVGTPHTPGPEKGKTAAATPAATRSRAGVPARGAAAETYAKRPKRPGFVRMVRGSDHLEEQLLTRHGRLLPAALPGLDRMLRFDPTATTTAAGAPPTKAPPVDPRLATLIGMVSDHFGGRTLHVVSGFRPFMTTQHTRHSNHNLAKAVDFSIEGVPNTVVRDFCRTFRNAGVGYYPNSTFVHLDVRSIKTYWIDYSAPGETPRYDSAAPPDTDDAERESHEDLGAGSSDTH